MKNERGNGFSTNELYPLNKNGLRRDSQEKYTGFIESQGEDLWKRTLDLLHRKELIHPSIISSEKQIEITKLSTKYRISSIAKKYDIDRSSCHNAIQETLAALVYLCEVDPENASEFLTTYGLLQLSRIDNNETARLSLSEYLEDTRIQELCNRLPSLSLMLNHQLKDGAISPYLLSLGFDRLPINIDSHFRSFAFKGGDTGVVTWLRKVLYKTWIDEKSRENAFGVDISPLLSKLALASQSGEVSMLNKEFKASENLTANFFNYISTNKEENFCKRRSILFQKVSPFLFLDSFRFLDFVDSVATRDLQLSAQDDICKVLDTTPEYAEKIYGAGIRVVDYLLLSQSENREAKLASWYLQRNQIDLIYRKYVEVAKDIYQKRNT